MTTLGRHECNARCDGDWHTELVWLLPLGDVVRNLAGGPPYEPGIVRSMLSTLFHHDGWRVREFALATEAGPSPYREHTEPWLVTVEPCPDCGPPTLGPFERDDA